MDSEISEAAVSAATQCSKDKICLESHQAPACRVVRLVNKSLHYISIDSDKECPYNSSFGCYRHCVCPVRKELYAKLKK